MNHEWIIYQFDIWVELHIVEAHKCSSSLNNVSYEAGFIHNIVVISRDFTWIPAWMQHIDSAAQ